METALYGRLIDCQDGCFYYQGDYGELYKISCDGKQKKLLIEKGAFWVIVKGDWIYYSNKTDRFSLYKIRNDGSSNSKLNNNISFNLHAYESFIWYTNIDDCRNICRMNPETCTVECINLQAGTFVICEDWIFFRDKKLENAISKAKVDGSQYVCLSNDAVGDYCISGNWLYYINRSKGNTIYKIDTDGAEPAKLCYDRASYLNILGGWLFYCNGNDTNKIYALREDGSLKLKAYDSEATFLKRIGNRIFFSDVKKGKLICVFSKIQNDGFTNESSDNRVVVQGIIPLNFNRLKNIK